MEKARLISEILELLGRADTATLRKVLAFVKALL